MAKLGVLLIVISFYPIHLAAQLADSTDHQNSDNPYSLAEVVVTASRLNSFQFRVPEPIDILKRKNADHFQLRTVPEALSIVPGVFIQKTNHGGGSPFVRGLTGNQTLLLIDGIRLSNSTMRYGPNQYLNTINVFGIEKIEILRGSGSVQYGSDAIGGAIQVFTRELTFTENEKLSAEALTRFATHGMEKSAHTTIDFSNKKFAFSGGLTWRDFGDLRGGDTMGTQTPTGYKEFDVDLKGKVLLSRNSFLTMVYQRVHQIDVPVYHKVVLENYAVNKMDPQLRQLTYLRYTRSIKDKWLKDIILTASYQDSEEERKIQKRGTQVLKFENDKVKTVAFIGELQFSKGNIWSGSSGIEFYHDLVGSIRKDMDLTTRTSLFKRGLYPDNSMMSGLAVYSLHSFDFRNWIISSGARYNTFVIRVDDAVLGATKLSPSALVGNLALLRKINRYSNMFMSLNTGFRAPNIDDSGTLGIVDFRYETPNFRLKPEKSLQYQLGYKVLTEKLRAEIYGYRNELYNLTSVRFKQHVLEPYYQ